MTKVLGRGSAAKERRQLTLLTLSVALLMGLWLNIGPVSRADAYGQQNFCPNAWLDRYGQPNDNCAANDKHYNYYVVVVPQEHSACVSVTTNNDKSGLTTGWTCSPGSVTTARYVDPKIKTNGIIRNNTTNDVNHASGGQNWCHYYNCQPY
jgi:hypothetical protein